MTHKYGRRNTMWTIAITSLALFMVSLDNLVVTTALPVIRHSLHASLSQLEWTVNAYTLTFAVLLLTGAALGDRFGRRRVFVFGLVFFLAAAAFVRSELRTDSPMLPMHFFRSRTFALTNVASLFMSFGMFGSIFFLAQFFQTVQHMSPLQSGLRILPWTAMPMLIAPIAGAFSDRIGGERLMAAGLALQASGLFWIAAQASPTEASASL